MKTKSPSQFRAFFALAWYAFRAQTRNPASFAFGFIFPVVFISVFGLIGNSTQKITVGIPDDTNKKNVVVENLQKQNFVTIEEGSQDQLQKRLTQGKIAGIVTVEEKKTDQPTYTVNLTVSSADPISKSSIISLLQGITDQTNLKLSGITNPPIVLEQKEISGRKYRYIDFALPGQIGFSLLSTAVFGTVFGLIFLKKSGVLKRMFATPTRAITILLSQATSRLIIALLQTILILALGIGLYGFYLPHGWITFFELIVLSIIGLIAFLGFGFYLTGIANDENAAGPLINLVTLPQFLLSGTFFATENLPGWIQPIANNLPLSYFNIAMRKITTEGGSLIDIWPYLLGLVAWGAVMYLLAARTFKWQ